MFVKHSDYFTMEKNSMLNRLLICLFTIFLICTSLPSPLTAETSALTIMAPCPTTPNCVVSKGADAGHQIEPLVYQGDRDTAYADLLKVLTVVPRTVVTEKTDTYIRAESTSRIFHFVDDLEFYFPTGEKLIQVRSAARVGESDLGVNRRRLEQIRLALKDLSTRKLPTKI
jgi:uncharacterized protein (DUF1499 family)